ncbi:MAG: hypothetical protein ACE5E8_03440 [Acidimicrobiia bacterium]
MWIEVVDPDDAEGELADLYEKQTAALGGPTDLTMIASLYPQLAVARAGLYQVVESCPSSLTPHERQAIALAATAALQSEYLSSGVEHKFLAAGGSAEEAARIRSGDLSGLTARVQQLGAYAVKVAVEPAGVVRKDVARCRATGSSDLDILDANNLGSYYSYLASICLGLGLTAAIG